MFRVSGESGFRVRVSRDGVGFSGFRVANFGLFHVFFCVCFGVWVSGSGFRVLGSGFRAWRSGFGVEGEPLSAHGLLYHSA